MALTIVSKAELWSGGAVLPVSFTIEDGSSINVSRSNIIRRTCVAVLTDPDGTLVSANASARDLFAPYGSEVVLYYGVNFNDGTPNEYVRCGVFGIEDVTIDDSGTDLKITVDGMDRGRAFQRDLITDSYTIPPNQNLVLQIQSLLAAAEVGFSPQYNFASSTWTTGVAPIVYDAGTDRWQSACTLAAAAGLQLFVDPNGIITLVPIPNPLYLPLSWTYNEGSVNLADEISRSLSRANAPNHIIRDGIGTGVAKPVRGEAMDTNPLSKMWVGGAYGDVVDYQSSPLYTVQAQAQVAANAALLLALGSVEEITLTAIPMPAHDVDDIVSVTRIRAGIPTGTNYVVDSFTLGFGVSGTLSLTARSIAGFLP